MKFGFNNTNHNSGKKPSKRYETEDQRDSLILENNTTLVNNQDDTRDEN